MTSKKSNGAKMAKISNDPEKEVVNSIQMKLVLIPAGEFTMGSPEDERNRLPNEGPQHKVRITKAFYMGVHGVKQSEYEKVMGENPSNFTDNPANPVEQVSWIDAVKFCTKLSKLPKERQAGRKYRLPTEAEWEYACRAGTTTPFHYGAVLSSKRANFGGKRVIGGAEKGQSKNQTIKVGSYQPNAWGLYDMHGNVWEWCLDGVRNYSADAVEDPKGPEPDDELPGPKGFEPAVLRGGCWQDGARVCRSAARYCGAPSSLSNGKGFRVVCGLVETE